MAYKVVSISSAATLGKATKILSWTTMDKLLFPPPNPLLIMQAQEKLESKFEKFTFLLKTINDFLLLFLIKLKN